MFCIYTSCAGVGPGPGAGAGAGQPDQGEGEPVCEECSQARNLIHCIDASIQVDKPFLNKILRKAKSS